MDMDLYVTKHRVIQDYLSQLTNLVNGTIDKANAPLIAELINKTTGVLTMHLASEDWRAAMRKFDRLPDHI